MAWEATQPVTHRLCCSFGITLVVVALLAPSAHVPPTWWQGGWRRQCVGSAEEVELLSSLAAVLMPKMPASELFRSFPSPDEEDDLEPTLTAYGVMKVPDAALFVLYGGKHGKRENITHELRKRLVDLALTSFTSVTRRADHWKTWFCPSKWVTGILVTRHRCHVC